MLPVNTNKLAKTVVGAIFSGGLSFIAFQAAADSSKMLALQNAVADDPSLELLLEGDHDQTKKIYLKSQTRAYELTCEQSAGLLSLVRATGVSTDLLPLAAVYSDVTSINEVEEKVGKLNCNNNGTNLRKIERIIPAEGEDQPETTLTEYYVTFDTNAGRLHRIGCEDLISAMSFTLDDAYLVPEVDIGTLFSLDDQDQIRCQGGEIPNPRERGLIISQRDIVARFGREILPVTIRDSVNEDAVPTNLQISENTCGDWLRLQDGDLVGTAPLEFDNTGCDIGLTATAGDVRYRTEHIRVGFAEDKAPVWASPTAKLTITVAPGQAITSDANPKAVDPDDAEPPTITMVTEEACNWVTGEQIENSFKLSGMAPSDAANRTCKVFLDATSHNKAASRRFEVTVETTTGVSLVWTEPSKNPIKLSTYWDSCKFGEFKNCMVRPYKIPLKVAVRQADGSLSSAENVTMTLYDWTNNATNCVSAKIKSNAGGWFAELPQNTATGTSCLLRIWATAKASGDNTTLSAWRRQEVRVGGFPYIGRIEAIRPIWDDTIIPDRSPIDIPEFVKPLSVEEAGSFWESMIKPSENANNFNDRCLSDLARSLTLSTENNIVSFADPQCRGVVDYQSLIENRERLAEIDPIFENSEIIESIEKKGERVFDLLIDQIQR